MRRTKIKRIQLPDYNEKEHESRKSSGKCEKIKYLVEIRSKNPDIETVHSTEKEVICERRTSVDAKKEIGYYAVRMKIEKLITFTSMAFSRKYSYIFIVSSIKWHSPN